MPNENTAPDPIIEYYIPDCALCTTAPAENRFDWIATHHRYLIGSTELADATEAMDADPLGLDYYFQCPACHATVKAFFGARANGLWIDKVPYVRLALWLATLDRERTAIVDHRTEEDITRLEREGASWGGVSVLRQRLRADDPRLWEEPFDDRERTSALFNPPRGLIRPTGRP